MECYEGTNLAQPSTYVDSLPALPVIINLYTKEPWHENKVPIETPSLNAIFHDIYHENWISPTSAWKVTLFINKSMSWPNWLTDISSENW